MRAIFYVGKGTRARPDAHLWEAFGYHDQPRKQVGHERQGWGASATLQAWEEDSLGSQLILYYPPGLSQGSPDLRHLG